ncbi:unnamed protein product, partial [Mesorhabditis spiculigera]
MLDRFGLRVSILLGAAGNCIGAWIRIFSTTPDAFWITMIGQTIVGASQMFTLGAPPRLAAVWFGADEVSTACAAGVFGNQLGIALGFVLPPMLVHNGTMEEIADDLTNLFLGSAVLNTVIFTLIICFFSAKPKVPPSWAQITALEQSLDSNFLGTMGKLLTNGNFMLLFLTYGMNTGVFYAVSTLLAEMVDKLYPGQGEAIGRIGLSMVVAGMFGSVIGGICLDKLKKFKLVTFTVYFFSFLGMVFFTFTLDSGIHMVYVGAIALGFFMTGYLPIGFEFAAELTFPSAEGTMSGLLNASAQIFGIALTWAGGLLLHDFGIYISNAVMIAILGLGTILTALIKEELRRQKSSTCRRPFADIRDATHQLHRRPGANSSGGCFITADNWANASYHQKQSCRQVSASGQLAEIRNAFDSQQALMLVESDNAATQFFYIGLSRNCETCGWTWPGNQQLDYQNWAPGQPVTGQDCSVLSVEDATWSSIDCGALYPALCLVPQQ